MGDVGTDGVDESKPGSSSPALALGVGAVALLVVFLAANRVFVNLEGPFGEHAVVGLLVSLAVAVAVGVLVTVATYAVARRSTWGLVATVGGLAAVAIVAFPTRIDRHESFVEQPNARSSCLGLTFTHYPPGTMDAASEIYCIGLERPAPAG
jgi:uncharacterized membrane protein (UPF0136 family)